ncbi:hypothetical protein ACUTEI_004006 [Cronobacter sakazakii]
MSEISKVIASEIADFFAVFGGPGEPDIQSGEAPRLLTERVLSVLALRGRAEPDYYVVVTSVGVWQSFHRNRAEAEFIVNKPFNPGYSILEIYTAPPAPVVPDEIIELLHAARSYVKSCAGSDGHAFGVLRAIDRACHSSMLQPVSQPYKLPASPQDESKPTKN